MWLGPPGRETKKKDFPGDSSAAPRSWSRSRSASDRPPSVRAPTDRKLRRDDPSHSGRPPRSQSVSTLFPPKASASSQLGDGGRGGRGLGWSPAASAG